jgi:hypothetical protein
MAVNRRQCAANPIPAKPISIKRHTTIDQLKSEARRRRLRADELASSPTIFSSPCWITDPPLFAALNEEMAPRDHRGAIAFT